MATSSLAAPAIAADAFCVETRLATMPEAPADDTFPKLVLQHATAPRRSAGDAREGPSASGRPGPGPTSPAKCAPSPAASRRSACERGDKVAIIGDNRPRLYWSMLAAAVPRRRAGAGLPGRRRPRRWCSCSITPRSRFAVVEDQEQVDKLIGIKQRLPLLQRIIYDDPRGLRHYTQD